MPLVLDKAYIIAGTYYALLIGLVLKFQVALPSFLGAISPKKPGTTGPLILDGLEVILQTSGQNSNG